MRLKGNEFPHYHDHHDLNVSILSGKGIIHFEDHDVPLVPGDVIFISKGTFHWTENTDTNASVCGIFSGFQNKL
ncbi:MAG: cupin domain-containing protein [Candidatus Marithrix sp.]